MIPAFLHDFFQSIELSDGLGIFLLLLILFHILIATYLFVSTGKVAANIFRNKKELKYD